MNHKLFTILLLAVLCMTTTFTSHSLSQETAPLKSFTESEALNLVQQWAAMVGTADFKGLDKLLNDRYIHIHGTGLVESKRQFLEAFINGVRRYDPIHIEDTTVRLFGDTAIVTGKFKLRAHVKAKIIEGVNRFSLTIAQTNAGKQIVSFQATAAP